MNKWFLVTLLAAFFLASCGGRGRHKHSSCYERYVGQQLQQYDDRNGRRDKSKRICASYQNSGGQTIEGEADGNGNCAYSASFLDAGNPLEVDMTIPALANGGAHLFSGSIFVGRNYDSDEDLAEAGITEGGDGPTLTVEAGATVAFATSSDFYDCKQGFNSVRGGIGFSADNVYVCL